ncbi:ribosomal protein L35 [Candida albicans L26]|uniref:50S ribosomal protein L35 n=4 Tax=Candida albicans TaxID=5476 RepID=A0A1D8PCD7_CANAL|nr:uncharacterized protein CAALFM_C100980WA [Candida albicans SC5314]EEQ43041.1 conserved hypothetical protein [Candida albicans WO-1]KAF6070208.1 Ribosomal protein L35 family protein [Candida albicans]KGQ98501.1 ribosomal protein L35 [Candida albicans P37005]KGQ99229.1 ribosomal protein L35 [Candida albicans P94015]KGR04109.1 ribosomal protein L35 [Candida albicans GC75]KGR21869.1 ribosomal protein L35 [Candida albicans P78048]KGR23166.1 ribosomal protein L35 [Candida albicans P37037]KGT72|eukprot:XP_019330608.1 hypothetical protein CAALFM_C100980WA [Candida albicans SC5314]
MFLNIIQSTSRILMGKPSSVNLLVQTRTKMKSHKAAANRFIKRASGLKRKQAGVNHGNGRFSYSALKGLRGFVEVSNKGGHLKKFINRV